MTYEEILQDALSRVDEKFSKRQDSPVFNGVAPACYEIAKTYEKMEEHLRQSFALTASGMYLDKIASEVGIERLPATYALKKVEFRDKKENLVDIQTGLRFAKDEFSFVVVKKIETGIYVLKAEQEGTVVNDIVGELLPIDYVDIASAKIVTNIEYAVDIETDEHLRQRYLQKVREPATSGNIYHYRRWALGVAGVGDVKVFPLWAGNGTVKIMIVTTDMEIADVGLIQKVREYIETVKPIGADVTVSTPSIREIRVQAKINISSNTNIETVKANVKESLDKYVKKLIAEYFKDVQAKKYYLSLAQVGKKLLENIEILDYKDLKLNDATENIEFSSEEIPKILVNLEVME